MKLICTIVLFVVALNASFAQSVNDGKYNPRIYKQNSVLPEASNQKRIDNSGRYIPMNDRYYMHTDDHRELGRYRHIHIPYNGGYGPYFHLHNPYLHIDNPYLHGLYPFRDEAGSPSDHYPFNVNEYDIPYPSILLDYGFPNHDPNQSKDKSSETVAPVTESLTCRETVTATTDSTTVTDSTENEIDTTTVASRQKRSPKLNALPATETQANSNEDPKRLNVPKLIAKLADSRQKRV